MRASRVEGARGVRMDGGSGVPFHEIGELVETWMDWTFVNGCIFFPFCIRGSLRWTCFARLLFCLGYLPGVSSWIRQGLRVSFACF